MSTVANQSKDNPCISISLLVRESVSWQLNYRELIEAHTVSLDRNVLFSYTIMFFFILIWKVYEFVPCFCAHLFITTSISAKKGQPPATTSISAMSCPLMFSSTHVTLWYTEDLKPIPTNTRGQNGAREVPLTQRLFWMVTHEETGHRLHEI